MIFSALLLNYISFRFSISVSPICLSLFLSQICLRPCMLLSIFPSLAICLLFDSVYLNMFLCLISISVCLVLSLICFCPSFCLYCKSVSSRLSLPLILSYLFCFLSMYCCPSPYVSTHCLLPTVSLFL